jgi:hypothetical protein
VLRRLHAGKDSWDSVVGGIGGLGVLDRLVETVAVRTAGGGELVEVSQELLVEGLEFCGRVRVLGFFLGVGLEELARRLEVGAACECARDVGEDDLEVVLIGVIEARGTG